MLAWITSNLWTIIISAGVIALVAGLIASLVKDKKAGKSSCGGSCAGCTGCSHAQKQKEK